MDAALPLSIRVSSQSAALILDASFALERLGLLASLRLAPLANVYLPRALLGMIDNDTAYHRHPQELGGSGIKPTQRKRMAEQLSVWHRAWIHGLLGERLHWVGDAHYESRMPGGEPADLLRRFELCAASFDARCLERQLPIHTPLHDCMRDTLALAAAMQPATAVVMTPVDEGEPPVLCNVAAEANIEAQPLDAPVYSPPIRDALLPLSSGRRYALVHVVAPSALVMPEPVEDSADWPDDEDVEAIGGGLWDGATLLWQELTLS